MPAGAAGLNVAGDSVRTNPDCFVIESVAGDSVRVNELPATGRAAACFEFEVLGFVEGGPMEIVAGDTVRVNPPTADDLAPGCGASKPGACRDESIGAPPAPTPCPVLLTGDAASVAGDAVGVNIGEVGGFPPTCIPDALAALLLTPVEDAMVPSAPATAEEGADRGGGGRGGGGRGFDASNGCAGRALSGGCNCFDGGGRAAGVRAWGGGESLPSGPPKSLPLFSSLRIEASLPETFRVALSSPWLSTSACPVAATGGSSNEPEPARTSYSTLSGLPGSSPITPIPMSSTLSTAGRPALPDLGVTGEVEEADFAADDDPSLP